MFVRIQLATHLGLVCCLVLEGYLWIRLLQRYRAVYSTDICFPKVHVIPCHFTRDLHYYGKSIFGKVKILFMFLSFNKNRYSCGSFANRKQHDVNFQRAEHTLSFMPFWLMKCFIGTL